MDQFGGFTKLDQTELILPACYAFKELGESSQEVGLWIWLFLRIFHIPLKSWCPYNKGEASFEHHRPESQGEHPFFLRKHLLRCLEEDAS